jgi:hypothetical protein
VVSSFCFCVVLVLLLLHLSVCFVSLWLTPRPVVVITNFWIHGMYVCRAEEYNLEHPIFYFLLLLFWNWSVITFVWCQWSVYEVEHLCRDWLRRKLSRSPHVSDRVWEMPTPCRVVVGFLQSLHLILLQYVKIGQDNVLLPLYHYSQSLPFRSVH